MKRTARPPVLEQKAGVVRVVRATDDQAAGLGGLMEEYLKTGRLAERSQAKAIIAILQKLDLI